MCSSVSRFSVSSRLAVSWASVISVGYLLVMGLLGLVVVSRRLGKLLLH